MDDPKDLPDKTKLFIKLKGNRLAMLFFCFQSIYSSKANCRKANSQKQRI